MSTKQQFKLYHEAMRHMDKATKIFSEKAEEEDGLYNNIKYVRAACASAYKGLLLATQCYLKMKGKPVIKNKAGRAPVEQYLEKLGKVDSNAHSCFKSAYYVLHLDGYKAGINSVGLLKAGFNSAMGIFNCIAPPGISHATELD